MKYYSWHEYAKILQTLVIVSKSICLRILQGLMRLKVIILSALLAIMIIIALTDYIRFKTRLTSAEWKADQVQMKLDSINEINGKTTAYDYSRIEYRSNN